MQQPDLAAGFRSGVVAVVGRPNVGKSTLVNAIVRDRVAAISPRAQTTRGRIFGIRTTPEHQIALVDTPGFHRGKTTLNEAMLNVVKEEAQGADLTLLVVDVTRPPQDDDLEAARLVFRDAGAVVLLVANKVDLLDGGGHLEAYRALGAFAEEHEVSAATGKGLVALEEAVARRLPEGPMLFPHDQTTDQDERARIAEVIREKALLLTHQEVPHAIAVEIEELREGKSPPTRARTATRYVRATIYVEKESQKAIVVGRGGERLKRIGQMARADLTNLLGTRLFLDLWVKVKEDWRDRKDVLRAWGFNV